MLFLDRLVNLISGMGGAKDKTIATAYALNLIPRDQLEAAYRSDWLSRKIVDIIPYDMTREWRAWQEKGAAIEALEATERRLGVRHKIATAMTRARLYGGAAIYIGVKGDRDPTKELIPDRIQKDGIEYLHVLSKHHLGTGDLDRDPASPYFGEPTYYEINTTSNNLRPRIHPSRLIRFVGSPVPDPLELGEIWGDPILQIVWDSIQNASSSQQQIAALLAEAKVDVIKVPGLSDALSTPEGTKMLTNRFSGAATLKSMFNMLLLEGTQNENEPGEVWEQKQLNFTQFPELLRLFMQVAAGAADIPVTRLLGQSPAGMNATGESDLHNYYDNLASKQEVELTPSLDRLDDVIIRSALGSRPKDLWYEWNSLWQLTAQELAAVSKTYAEVAAIYAREAIVPTAVLEHGVKGRLVEDGTFPGIEQAYDDEAEGNLEPLVEEPEIDIDPITGQPIAVNPDVDPKASPKAVGKAQTGENVVPLRRRVQARDAAPKTLYVRRDVKNAAEIRKHYTAQGLTVNDDLHVTVCFSRAPIDWMAMSVDSPELTIDEGGPRVMDLFGGSLVLLISSWSLNWRHEEFIDRGATHDFPKYNPHITIAKAGDGININDVKPYLGPIELGPEIFEELKDEGKPKEERA